MKAPQNTAGMHVVQVVPSLAIGGQEMVVFNLLKALRRQGLEQSVLVFEAGGELTGQVKELGVRLIELHKKPGIDLGLALRMGWRFNRIKPSLVHAHNVLAAFYAGLAARPQGIPVVFTRHGTSPRYAARFRAGWVAARMSSRIAGVSKKVAGQIASEHKIPARKISVVPNGVDSERFRPDPVRRGRKRAELGIADDETVLITIGRLVVEKDYPCLLKAAAELHGQGHKLRLLFAGDGPERAALESLAAELNLAERTCLLGVRHDIPELLNAGDVFCLSSRTEGAPMSIIEAMASGLPVVGTECGGMAELVIEGQTGYLVPVGDWQALAAALCRFMKDPGLARNMGAKARELQLKNYSVRAMAEAYLSIYRQTIG